MRAWLSRPRSTTRWTAPRTEAAFFDTATQPPIGDGTSALTIDYSGHLTGRPDGERQRPRRAHRLRHRQPGAHDHRRGGQHGHGRLRRQLERHQSDRGREVGPRRRRRDLVSTAEYDGLDRLVRAATTSATRSAPRMTRATTDPRHRRQGQRPTRRLRRRRPDDRSDARADQHRRRHRDGRWPSTRARPTTTTRA